jgi:hypothetical protein
MSEVTIDRGNTLFPVFVKLERLRLLIVGAWRSCRPFCRTRLPRR